MSEEMLFAIGVLALGTAIIITVLILTGTFAKARIARREEEKLEELIQRYDDLATQIRNHQDALAADTSDVRRRVVEVERMLREVN
jgi:uncharacterized membrane protein